MAKLTDFIPRVDLERHAPPGFNVKSETGFFLGGLACAWIYSMGFFLKLGDAVSNLYVYDYAGIRVLREDAYMPECRELLGSSLMGFVILAFAMLTFVLSGYAYHRQGARADYLMRRLTDGFEYHRRCWTLPLAASILSILTGVLLLNLYYAIYLLATPNQIQVSGQWQTLWTGGFLFWL